LNFKKWALKRKSVDILPKALDTIHSTKKSDFSLTSYHAETKNLAYLKYQKGHNSGKNCRKIVIIELNLYIPKIHLYTIPSFNPTSFTSYPETKNLVSWKHEKGHNSDKNCRKIVIIELELDIIRYTYIPHLASIWPFVRKLSSENPFGMEA
jgi:hypothetical protein